MERFACGSFARWIAGSPWPAGVVLGPAIALIVIAASSRAAGLVDFAHPFHSEQCDFALRWSAAALAAAPADAHALRTRAEALLCHGVDDDDPVALNQAIAEFERLLRGDNADFFAHLYLTEALRRRFPLSDAALRAALETNAALEEADVGAARPELDAFAAEQLASVRLYRELHGPELRAQLARIETGALSGAALGEGLLLLAQTGTDGLAEARRRLQAYLAGTPDPVLASYYAGELERDSAPAENLIVLYRAAIIALCQNTDDYRRQCEIARWRLEHI